MTPTDFLVLGPFGAIDVAEREHFSGPHSITRSKGPKGPRRSPDSEPSRGLIDSMLSGMSQKGETDCDELSILSPEDQLISLVMSDLVLLKVILYFPHGSIPFVGNTFLLFPGSWTAFSVS